MLTVDFVHLTVDRFDSLLQCHEMEDFVITGISRGLEDAVVKVTIDLTDKDLDSISNAWPRLRVFKITTTGHSALQRKPLVTLAGLDYFARNCPLLEHLRMPVDATAWDERDQVAPAPSIRTVSLDVSVIKEGAKVDERICAMWPNLERGGSSFSRYVNDPAGGMCVRAWQSVEARLNAGRGERTRFEVSPDDD